MSAFSANLDWVSTIKPVTRTTVVNHCAIPTGEKLKRIASWVNRPWRLPARWYLLSTCTVSSTIRPKVIAVIMDAMIPICPTSNPHSPNVMATGRNFGVRLTRPMRMLRSASIRVTVISKKASVYERICGLRALRPGFVWTSLTFPVSMSALLQSNLVPGMELPLSVLIVLNGYRPP